MRKLFHSPAGLSAFTSGSRPGVPFGLFHSPPLPFALSFFTCAGSSGSHT